MLKLNYSLFIFTLLITTFSFAQFEVKGRLIDENGKSLDLSEIQIVNTDSIVVNRTLSDSDGHFELSLIKGTYFLKVISFSKTIHSQKIELTSDINLGNIKVIISTILSEVVIANKKKVIKRDGEKLILNVKGNELFNGKNSLEILRYAPFVWIDNNLSNITVKGNSVTVLINGKQSNLSGNDLFSYLNSIPNGILDSIEVITNPSAKYNAQGGSIVNIITKSPPKQGLYGNINSGVWANDFINSNLSLFVNSTLSEKFSINAFIVKNNATNRREEKRTEVLNSPNVSYNYFKKDTIKSDYNYYSTSMIYEINSKNQIGAGLSYSLSKSNTTQNNDLTIASATSSTSLGNYSLDSDNEYYTLSLNYKLKMDNKGQSLNAIMDLYNTNFKNTNSYENLFFDSNAVLTDSNIRKSYSPLKNNISSYQVDYVKPFRNNKIEIGAKYSSVDNKNETTFQDFILGNFVENPNFTNDFSYKEKIAAGYITWSKDSLFNTKISLKTGLRVESTNGTGEIPSVSFTIDKHYTNFFPSLFLNRSFSQNRSLYFSYSRRILRPNYRSFNSTIFYLTEFTSQVGNPNLNPSFTDAFEIGYSASNLNLLLFSDLSQGEHREILKRLNANLLQYEWRNIDHSENIGVYLSANKKITKWLELFVNSSWYIKKYTSSFADVENINSEKGTFQARVATAINLPFKINSEVSFEYNGSETYGQYESGENYSFYLNLSKKVNTKLSLYLKVTDPFGNLRYNFYNTQSELRTSQLRNNYNRSITFSAVYSFDFGRQTKSIEIDNGIKDLRNRSN